VGLRVSKLALVDAPHHQQAFGETKGRVEYLGQCKKKGLLKCERSILSKLVLFLRAECISLHGWIA
jgi:hypothetical protein